MFNQVKYEESKEMVRQDIMLKKISCYDYMEKYKQMIIKEDYEGAKAVTDVLKEYGYDTFDTHKYLKFGIVKIKVLPII